MFLSVVAFWFIVYSYIRQQGLLAFMPAGLKRMMTEVAFFDILVDIFIHRKMSKMVISIVQPFMNAETPEEVKKIFKEEGKLTVGVYKGLFRKGIMNNFSPSVKTIMLPAKEPMLAKQLRRGTAYIEINDQTPKEAADLSQETIKLELDSKSAVDLMPVGRQSELDDYFDKPDAYKEKSSLEQKEKSPVK